MSIPRDVLQLSSMLSDPAWLAYKARCEAVIKVWTATLLDPSKKRSADLSDDYLRGRIDALTYAISWPDSIVKQHMMQAEDDRDADRLERTNDARARLGFSFPGIN